MSKYRASTNYRSQQMDQEADDLLLCYMACKETADDYSNSRDAFGSFYRRHIKYLFSVCKGFVDDNDLPDLVQETFFRAYQKADTFKDQGAHDPIRISRLVRAWLGKIAENIKNEWYRSDSVNRDVIYDSENIETVPAIEKSDVNHENPSEIERLFFEAFDFLSDRERDVLRSYWNYFDPRKVHNRLPNVVVNELSIRWETTSENIRQIKSRAEKKVKDYVNNSIEGAKGAKDEFKRKGI